MNPVFVALDTVDAGRAHALATALAPHVGGVKLGLEFFCANGPAVVRDVAGETPLFLDLKLHDIPNTVAGAVRAVAPLRPAFLTLHASGGPAMLRAAADAAGGRMKLLGVTVLTSLDEGDLERVGQRGAVSDQARRLARLARESGLAGVVCSPHEIRALRADCGPDFLLVVPGIRPPGTGSGDQKRVMTPSEALAAGADHLVVGRPITAASDPVAAARSLFQ
jgi:orotidine-5'-phosphate decarboxylase